LPLRYDDTATAPTYADRMSQDTGASAASRVRSWLRRVAASVKGQSWSIRPGLASRKRLALLGAATLFAVALATVTEVLDVDGVPLLLAAAAAALPLGLITTRPALGWLLSAASALAVSRAFTVVDGDPWPWPIVHGLVLLALLFAVSLHPPTELNSRDRGITVGGAWFATAALFAFSVPRDLIAGWVVGVTAVVAAGVVLRLLAFGELPAIDRERATPVSDAVTRLLAGFREAFVSWVPSPPAGPPFGERLFRRLSWYGWLRGAFPWLLAFGTFWIGVASIQETLQVHDLVLPFLAAAIALPVGLAGRYALLGWRVATLIAIVISVAGGPGEGLDLDPWPGILEFVWMGLTFLISVRHDRWTVGWVWAATVAGLSTGLPATENVAGWIAGVTALVVVGDLVRTRRQASAELERQTELSELEKARRAVLEERTRIARDLHDVVAHHMSMVVVQAESAPYRLADVSDETKAEFATISESARDALTEIRGLLGVLRSDDDAAARAPQPGVEQLDDLIDGAVRAGIPVTLSVTGSPRRVRPAIGLSVYRILQESLANAARHAPGSDVRVDLHYDDAAVHLRVLNAASNTQSTPEAPGHGIAGMRERAAVVGGTLRAGPTPDGGFDVTATLPTTNAQEDDA
jgi:signal transduction histidine kinase